MATKQNTKKTRVSNRAKASGLKFKWWMAVILVVIVAGAGLLVLRFSHAATTTSFAYEIRATRYNNPYGDYKYYINDSRIRDNGQDVTITYHHTESNGIVIYYMRNANVSTCGYIFKQGAYGGGFKDSNAPTDPGILYPGGTFLWANSTCDRR